MPKKSGSDYEDLSLDELDQVIIDLSNERAVLRERQLAVTAVYDAKAAAAKLDRVAATLSDAEKAALLQQIRVDAAASAEAVGTPRKV